MHCCNPLCNWLCSMDAAVQLDCRQTSPWPWTGQSCMLQTPGAVIMINSGTCFATFCAELLYRNLQVPGLSRWFLSRVAFSPVMTHEGPLAVQACARSCTPQLSCHPAASPSSQTLPLPSCSSPSCHPSSSRGRSAHPLLGLWEVVLAAAGQARPSSMTQVHTTLLA